MPRDPGVIYTVGYEGRSTDDFLTLLRTERVDLLVDTRLRTGSRKRGFSRNALMTHLAGSKIDYMHDVALGTPPELMAERRKAGTYDLEVYADHFDANPAVLERTAAGVEGRVIALMCFELDPRVCHRSIVADRLARLTGRTVRHL